MTFNKKSLKLFFVDKENYLNIISFFLQIDIIKTLLQLKKITNFYKIF